MCFPVPSPDLSFQPDEHLEVYVSAYENPNHFWIQILGVRSLLLDKLTEEMNHFYNNSSVTVSTIFILLHLYCQILCFVLPFTTIPQYLVWFKLHLTQVYSCVATVSCLTFWHKNLNRSVANNFINHSFKKEELSE